MSGLIPIWARVGAKCICINRDGWEWDSPPSWFERLREKYFPPDEPSYGGTYAVKGSEVRNGRPYLFLEETPHNSYAAHGFRPVQEISAERDVAQFKHLAPPVVTTTKAPADA